VVKRRRTPSSGAVVGRDLVGSGGDKVEQSCVVKWWG
jgi:hypothetical protein